MKVGTIEKILEFLSDVIKVCLIYELDTHGRIIVDSY